MPARPQAGQLCTPLCIPTEDSASIVSSPTPQEFEAGRGVNATQAQRAFRFLVCGDLACMMCLVHCPPCTQFRSCKAGRLWKRSPEGKPLGAEPCPLHVSVPDSTAPWAAGLARL
eukprot:gene5729-biopygen4949